MFMKYEDHVLQYCMRGRRLVTPYRLLFLLSYGLSPQTKWRKMLGTCRWLEERCAQPLRNRHGKKPWWQGGGGLFEHAKTRAASAVVGSSAIMFAFPGRKKWLETWWHNIAGPCKSHWPLCVKSNWPNKRNWHCPCNGQLVVNGWGSCIPWHTAIAGQCLTNAWLAAVWPWKANIFSRLWNSTNRL